MAVDASKFERALYELWPHGDDKIVGLRAGIVASIPHVFRKYPETTDALVLANMMGEFTEECGAGLEVEENLNYRASVLVSQWPTHFTEAQALQCQHNPRMVADRAYDGRMGNVPGTDDGWTFRGRGPSQTTGRTAYGILGQYIGIDLLNDPDMINTPRYFLEAGVVDFVKVCACLPYAQRDDEVNETRHLNGGLIGLARRQASITLWKRALA